MQCFQFLLLSEQFPSRFACCKFSTNQLTDIYPLNLKTTVPPLTKPQAKILIEIKYIHSICKYLLSCFGNKQLAINSVSFPALLFISGTWIYDDAMLLCHSSDAVSTWIMKCTEIVSTPERFFSYTAHCLMIMRKANYVLKHLRNLFLKFMWGWRHDNGWHLHKSSSLFNYEV